MTSAIDRSRSRRRRAGFTLVELLMATTAGLMVSAAAFLLAKNASTVFQEETRITAAQLSASLGLQRIVTDLGRAGFLSTPNVQTDPFVCNESGSWPLAISQLRAVTLEEAGSVNLHGAALSQSVDNGFRPDTLTISGSFDAAEELPVRAVEGDGAVSIYLETESLPLKRLCGCSLATETACQSKLQRIFKPDRILRLRTGSGFQIFGIIESLVIGGDTQVVVKLQPSPTVPRRSQNPRGFDGQCLDCTVNTVSIVRYEIQNLAGHPQYGPLVTPLAVAATGDDGRTELTRVELDKDGLPVPDTLELVAEFAVDLKLGISIVNQGTTAVQDVPISSPTNPLVYTTAPERIRSVHVRLSTRARAPDRDSNIPADPDAPSGPDGRRHRFKLNIGNKLQFARMRTLYTEVALQNLVRGLW